MGEVGDFGGFPLEEISHEVDYLRTRSWFYALPLIATGQPQRGTPAHTLDGTPCPLEMKSGTIRRLQWGRLERWFSS